MSYTNNNQQNDYGFPTPLQKVGLIPIVANRAPLTNDFAPIGQTWIFPANGSGQSWTLVSVIGGSAIWNLTEAGGGGGTFATLTSTGATTLATTDASVNTFGNTTGATSLALAVGTGGFTVNGVGASNYTIGAATTTGTISIGGTAESGALTLGSSSAAQPVNIANGAGASTVAIANVQTGGSVSIGGGMTTGSVTIAPALTTGSLNLGALTETTGATNIFGGGVATSGIRLSTGAGTAAGFISIAPQAGTSGTTAITMNTNVGIATFTGLSTAAGAKFTLTINNALITATSFVNVNVANISVPGTAFIGLQGIVQSAGSIVLNLINNGTTALVAGGNVLVSFSVNS